jgi:hypothetical protein
MSLPPWNFRALLLLAAVSLLASAAAAAGLTVLDLTLRQFEGGRAWIPGYTPAAGETFAFDFRVAGFASVEGDFDAKLNLRFQAELVDGAGRAMAKPVSGASSVDITEEDRKKDWKPKFSGEFQLPVLLRKQEAVLRVTVEDQIAGKKATAERRFTIAGPVIPADSALAVTGFRFLRTEEDLDPLSVPAYRQGDAVWGRFEIVGFQTSGDGEIAVNYGVEVENAAGKRLFTQEVAAEERRQFFYPPAYVPGLVSLQLQSNTPPGEYTVRILVRDALASKTASSTHVFRIE